MKTLKDIFAAKQETRIAAGGRAVSEIIEELTGGNYVIKNKRTEKDVHELTAAEIEFKGDYFYIYTDTVVTPKNMDAFNLRFCVDYIKSKKTYKVLSNR